ncbi:MAG TPA: L-histidine N(alpha)-methyltransferase [Bryobacteraceae bacterium]|nr:L-histidine N(alpha)-methyltransferase [Bryobacteraceae bacterium]
MNIEVLLTEAEIAEEFAEAMEARDLPEKYFYWTPLSIKAWKELSAAANESLRQTWDALALKAGELTRSFGARIPMISFGAGDGIKDRILLKALREAGREVKYFPIDASQTLLETACAGAEDDDCEALGLKADISSPVHLLLAADVSEAPRLFLMVGNTLGGFDPLDLIKHVAGCLHEGDILILDAQITDADQEPTEVRKAFIFAPLAGAGIGFEDGELKFEEKQDDRREGLFLMTRRFQASRDLTMNASGREIHIERGERIFLNFRYRFSREALRWLLTKQGGLKIKGEIPSADGQYVTAICVK